MGIDYTGFEAIFRSLHLCTFKTPIIDAKK